MNTHKPTTPAGKAGRVTGLILGYVLVALTAAVVLSLGIAAIVAVWGWIL